MRTVELGPGVVCIELQGELDLSRAYDFDRAVQAAERPDVQTVVVDLREVTFLDSAGVARIIAARRRAERAGRRFAIVRGSRAVERLIKLTALDQQIEVVDDPHGVL
jgi:anti-sigma B factor antagonist